MTEAVDLTETDDEKPSTRNASQGNTLPNDRLRVWMAMPQRQSQAFGTEQAGEKVERSTGSDPTSTMQ